MVDMSEIQGVIKLFYFLKFPIGKIPHFSATPALFDVVKLRRRKTALDDSIMGGWNDEDYVSLLDGRLVGGGVCCSEGA